MIVNNIRIDKVEIDLEQVSQIQIPPQDSDFDKYINDVLNHVAAESGGRKFKIRSENTQVIAIVKKAVMDANYEQIHEIGERLLRHEMEVQSKINKLEVEISPGILIKACISEDNVRKYIICKAEDTAFINEKNYNKERGYPVKKKIIKSFIAVFDEENEISEILITDSSSKIAKYWWDDFLELDKCHDDAYNTLAVFDSVEKILSRYKKKYPADHMQLRNAVITMVRTKGEFNYDKFVGEVFENYEPVDSTINMRDIIGKIKELPQKHNFDKVFETVPSEVTAKIKSVVNLAENVDLLIKQDIDIPSLITPYMGTDNNKYIMIKSDHGYEVFKNRQKVTL